MTKMTETQRTAILRQHRSRNHGNSIIANARTITVLVREGWAVYPTHVTPAVVRVGKVRTAYVTPAGLRAAGVDLDELHGAAIVECALRNADVELCRLISDERRRLSVSGFRGNVDLMAWGNVRNRLHAEALAEYREVTRAARKADADAYQRELQRDMGLRVKS
jgi:hypothetical protein